MKYISLTLFNLLFILGTLSAQVQKIVHQEFDISDSIVQVQVQIYGEYEVEAWPGNNILLETQIGLYNATEGILKHFLEIGRYKLEAENAGSSLKLVSKDEERRPIRTSKGECFEDVEQRLYIPEEFIETSTGIWQRPLRVKFELSPNTLDQQVKGGEIPAKEKPEKKDGEGGNG